MSPRTLQGLKMWMRELGKLALGLLLERISVCPLEGRAKVLASSLFLGDGTGSEKLLRG